MDLRPLAPLLVGLALVACNEADTGSLGGLRVPDAGAGPADAAVVVPDSGREPFDGGPGPRDGGFLDAGPPPDAGPVCARPTAAGGCACEVIGDPRPFVQADCPDPRDVCVPWDRVSSGAAPLRPFARCARPCRSEVDCGPAERCADVGLPAGSGAERICVDRVADVDERCSGARVLPREAVTQSREVQQPRERVGCVGGATCVRGLLEDAHIDEGVCVDRCTTDADCAAPTPYCNPSLLEGLEGPTGVCSERRLGRGGVCGTSDPNRLGLTNQCDTSPSTPFGTACVQVPGLFAEGEGFCVTPCQSDLECQDFGVPTCTLFGGGFGLCIDDCTSVPDSCEGPGADGVGRVCQDYLSDEFGQPAGFCMDRRPPPLTPTLIDAEGSVVEQGDNCFSGPGSDFLRCPEPTSCVIVDFQNGQGLCIFGCDPTAMGANARCAREVGPGSTCVGFDMGGGGANRGYCAAP